MKRQGVTLIELLIVVAVMTILMGIALPIIKHGIEGHRTNSAAQIVRNQFRLAAALAAERNEPSGVALIVDPGSSAAMVVGVLAPVPARYCGDIVGSTAFVSRTGPTGLRAQLADGSAGSLIRPGDEIRFNHLWDRCHVVAVSAAGPTWILDLRVPTCPPALNAPLYTAHYPFVVFRKPTSVTTKTEVPRGTCVDLSASGYGAADIQFGTGASVTATMFFDVQPNGSISSIRFAGSAVEQVPAETIHLLIGEVDGAGIVNAGLPENVRLSHANWIRIHPRTGRTVVVPNYWTDTTATVQDARSLED